jgi:hypothetical protein
MITNCLVSLKRSDHPVLMVSLKEGEEAWLLNMGKYFQIYNYPGNLRARLVVYQLNGKVSIGGRRLKQ